MKFNKKKLVEFLTEKACCEECIQLYGFDEKPQYCITEDDCDKCWDETLNAVIVNPAGESNE